METVGSVVNRRKLSVYAIPGLNRTGVSPDKIDEFVAAHFGMITNELRLVSRKREVVMPRQLAMYFCKKYTRNSLAAIGARYGKNHATVLHACKTVANLAETDEGYLQTLKAIQRDLSKLQACHLVTH